VAEDLDPRAELLADEPPRMGARVRPPSDPYPWASRWWASCRLPAERAGGHDTPSLNAGPPRPTVHGNL